METAAPGISPSPNPRPTSVQGLDCSGCGREEDLSKGEDWREDLILTHPCLQSYVPTVFENYTASFEIDKRRIELNMWDTSGS